MDIERFMRKHHVTDEMLDEMAAPFERGDFELSDGTMYSGSHLGAGAPKTPNAETIEAIDEVRRRKQDPSIGKTYDSVENMMKDLL
ncbi:hypothetical protein GCM10007377_15230 [Galliscardovia ingluviei]|uniref:Uncharacterized protein n=1 Tax=Galliscardovia ingluviei TaxID=1769422 RepID=A0A8J3EZU7_9BIFI|nr:hypothetical protein [Galliscardovia ingluviei]GGI15304.1 hypothetical protein GCM10007377_15230 [Galliscardovia ingluviei]